MTTVKLLLDFHRAAGLPFPATAQWADKIYNTARSNPDWLCVERPGGVLIGMIGPSLLGPFKVAQELAWWVDPAHRGNSLGMLREYEEWATLRGVSAIEVKSLALFPETERLYERAGYSRLETSWVRWL
jgi:RimJ/RimL family protein N-acetyltransferase